MEKKLEFTNRDGCILVPTLKCTSRRERGSVIMQLLDGDKNAHFRWIMQLRDPIEKMRKIEKDFPFFFPPTLI